VLRRTYYEDVRMTKINYIALAIIILILAIGLYRSSLSGMGTIPYNP